MTTTTADYVKEYVDMGWSLVAIPAGSKAPATFGWQQKATPAEYWDRHPTHNIGLLHGMSGTCSLDIDHMANTRLICEAMNIDLDELMSDYPRIVGRPDRAKVLFRVPDGDPLVTRKISWPVEGDGRKTEVVFELRAGSVQDVLPPSVHPDTGNPYTWAGTCYKDLPELPEQLLVIWRKWDRFRTQMMDVCPWRSEPQWKPPAKKRRIENQQSSVIDQYNDAVSLADAFTEAGYKQFGNRWLSPNSTSRIPGAVIFEDGRGYSHHASDPFDPAHSIDAFEVFCQYQHMGNASAAVKAAVEVLKLDALPLAPTDEERAEGRLYAAHGASVYEGWKNGRSESDVYKKLRGDTPPHLMTIPGVLGDLVDWADRTSVMRQPQLAVQAGLAFGAVVLGQRYITSTNNMASMFFLNVAKTGAGKEHARSVVSRALDHAGLDHLEGPAGYTSEGGVLSALKAAPAHVTMIDEFGNYLKTTGNKASVNQQQALSMMMECFGRQTGQVSNRGYSTVGMTDKQSEGMKIRVRNPSLTVLAMTTPETFYEAITGRDIASGLLNRFLIVESKIGYQKAAMPDRTDPPESVMLWARKCASTQLGSGNLQDLGPEFPPEPVIMPFTDAASALLSDYEDDIIARRNATQNPAISAMMNRCREMTMRVSLIVAVSLGLDEVTDDAMRWSIDYVDFYTQRAIVSMADHMSEGDHDALRKKIAVAIRMAGASGISKSELLKAVPGLGNLKRFDRDNILLQVCEDYEIQVAKQKTGRRGAPPTILTWSADVH